MKTAAVLVLIALAATASNAAVETFDLAIPCDEGTVKKVTMGGKLHTMFVCTVGEDGKTFWFTIRNEQPQPQPAQAKAKAPVPPAPSPSPAPGN